MASETSRHTDDLSESRFDAPGLYLHIPFCTNKCAYCDFVSGVFPHTVRAAYLSAVREEFKSRSGLLPKGFTTVYIGGGSPSSLEGGQWRSLVEFLHHFVRGMECCEVTVEMNPSQVTEEKLSSLEELATRISLGAQTFEPTLRKTLERKPFDPVDIDRAAAMIQGRFALNVDLIHSIPGQTRELLDRDLRRIAELDCDHVSAYALMLEKGTPLYGKVSRGELQPVDEDFACDALQHVRTTLKRFGFIHYEISNFAKPRKECMHNLAVWAGGEYLGIGAGACSYLSGERIRNEPDVTRYIEQVSERGEAVCDRERLDEKRRAGELAMLHLRTRSGIDRSRFASQTGFDPSLLFRAAIEKHTQAGLLEVTNTHIRLTEAGLDLADTVMIDFIW